LLFIEFNRMRVFKFGGASVKDAESVKNVLHVLQKVGHQETLVVVSAMGKTTNALEVVIKQYRDKDPKLSNTISELRINHKTILTELFENNSHPIFEKIDAIFDDLSLLLERNKSPKYDYIYDQVVSYGEIISTTILSAYFEFKDVNNEWLDARNLIKTDSTYRDAKVDWKETQNAISTSVNSKTLTITQGFIGADTNNFTTTLGREGSDYSAGIFAFSNSPKNITTFTAKRNSTICQILY